MSLKNHKVHDHVIWEYTHVYNSSFVLVCLFSILFLDVSKYYFVSKNNSH